MGMKYLKMYENFNEEDIHAICRKYKITNYTINNGVVDVDDDVCIYAKDLTELPLKFGKVTGTFWCFGNKLTSLIGSPSEVGMDFDCSENKLTNLEGGPTKIGRSFNCIKNQLTTLEGCPKEVVDSFYCSYNSLTSLEGCPSKVDGDFYCHHNNLVTLEVCPKEVGEFDCTKNPVCEIYYLFPSHTSYIDSLDYNYFRDSNKINKIRLTQALEEIGLKCPESIKWYIWE